MKVCELLNYQLSFSENLNTVKFTFLNNISFIDTTASVKHNKNPNFKGTTCALIFPNI